jgi:hypothetical protein
MHIDYNMEAWRSIVTKYSATHKQIKFWHYIVKIYTSIEFSKKLLFHKLIKNYKKRKLP